MCECILGWRSVPSHFGVTVTLTSDLFSRISIKSGANLLYSWCLESQVWCIDASLDNDMLSTIFGMLGHYDLDLVSRVCIEFGAYLGFSYIL